jgi:hypothetical protein
MKGVSAMALALAIALPPSAAMAQSAKGLVGAWDLESAGESWGRNPKGRLLFSANGRYALIITRNDLPKIASNSRVRGTPEENKAVAAGSIGHFGRYSVDEKAKTIALRIEGSSFANWNGTEQTRPFVIKGNQLRYTNPKPSAGGAPTGEVVWNRVK